MSRIDNAVIKVFEIFLSLCYGLDFTLPYPDNAPSKGFQFSFVTDITGNITLYLLFPELDIGLWQAEIPAILMPVPEASVDENDGLVLRQDNIRISQQLPDLNTETQTAREKILPHNQFRVGILSLYSAIQRLRCSVVITSAIM